MRVRTIANLSAITASLLTADCVRGGPPAAQRCCAQADAGRARQLLPLWVHGAQEGRARKEAHTSAIGVDSRAVDIGGCYWVRAEQSRAGADKADTAAEIRQSRRAARDRR